MRYLINLSYNGSKYYGYQIQNNNLTIEGEIEKVLSKILNTNINTIASSRTDKSVHALDQYCHFDYDKELDTNKLVHSMNSLLDGSIYIKSIKQVDDDFNARFNVKNKEYIYKINMGEYNPIERDYIYQYNHRLDISEMERALKYLEGEHNFKSFTKTNEEITDYVRTISQTSIVRDSKDINKITITFVGTGFMRYMVRNMVGLLIEIGEGKRQAEEIIEILKNENRTLAGKTAPACGLYLRNVFY